MVVYPTVTHSTNIKFHWVSKYTAKFSCSS